MKNLIKYTIGLFILIPATIVLLWAIFIFGILDIGLITSQIILFGYKKPFVTLTEDFIKSLINLWKPIR